MGALLTPRGKVGTGFTDKQREEWYEWFMTQPCGIYDEAGEKPTRFELLADGAAPTIEVDCWELTKDGKFRHPRYIRLREDK
jgi:DNA ligase-1